MQRRRRTAPGSSRFVGRPNAGKSTLTNALVGEKVVITSSKPQTTRRVVRGIVHRPDAQLVVLDTPGLHRPRTLLGERLNDEVRAAWSQVDVVGFCLPADEKTGPGDRFIARELAALGRVPKVAVVTKTDRVSRDRVAEALMAVAELGREEGVDWAEVVPVSAVAGDQVELLAGLLAALMPESPPLYQDGELTDEPELVLVAELDPGGRARGRPRRAAALDRGRRRGDAARARTGRRTGRCSTCTPTSTSSGTARRASSSARRGPGCATSAAGPGRQIEALLGTPVFLDLHVTVAKDWQRDPRQLRKLGF